jgi:hypothetical protein
LSFVCNFKQIETQEIDLSKRVAMIFMLGKEVTLRGEGTEGL